jgi:hypothetical protein
MGAAVHAALWLSQIILRTIADCDSRSFVVDKIRCDVLGCDKDGLRICVCRIVTTPGSAATKRATTGDY